MVLARHVKGAGGGGHLLVGMLERQECGDSYFWLPKRAPG